MARPTIIITHLNNLPHTPEGDRDFLQIVEQLPSWTEAIKLLVKEELLRRTTIHEALTRLLWKHQESDPIDRRRAGHRPQREA